MSSDGLRGLSRRDFLKYCAATAAALGLSELAIPRIAAAIEAAAGGKTPIIWLTAQGCKGCATSLLNSDEPSPARLILDSLSMRFFPLLMAASGDLAISAVTETMRKNAGEYVLLVEGAVPLGEAGRFATMGFESSGAITLEAWIKRVSRGALATIAVGTCAAYGGIPVLYPPANAKSTEVVLAQPIPAVPGCPPHPDWVVGTLVKLLLFGKGALMRELDGDRRPKEFFSELVHDNCPRRASFDAGVFIEEYNDSLKKDNACLLRKGCRGPVTHADCPSRRWNQRMNWCIGAGAPCNGCTEPAFYAGLAPLFEPLPSVKLPGSRPLGIGADALGRGIMAATAVGVGAHMVAQVARGKIGAKRAEEPAGLEERQPVQDVASDAAGSHEVDVEDET